MMNKLRTICATVVFALAFSAPVFAEGGQMGTGGQKNTNSTGQMGTGGTQAVQLTPTDDASAVTMDDLLLAAELAIWQSLIGQL